MLGTDAVGTYYPFSAIVKGLLLMYKTFFVPLLTMILFALEYELILASVIPATGSLIPFLSKAAESTYEVVSVPV